MIEKKKNEKNNIKIALNVLYARKEKICPAYVLKHNSNREGQVISLMIPNAEGRHHLAVKSLFVLLRGITFKHHGDIYCLNCLYTFTTENKREYCKKVCENKDVCKL